MSDARLLRDVEGQVGWDATVREFGGALRGSLLRPGAAGDARTGCWSPSEAAATMPLARRSATAAS